MRYICTSIVATLALVGTSFAATINVPGDHATIQGAINASSVGDVIAIAAGTYHEHSLNPGGKAITIGSASGNLDVTIDANGGGSVFVIDEGEGSGTVIQNLVITGVFQATGGYGGGIYCKNSSPTIADCTISDNTVAWFGGGIYCYDNSNPTITGCTISGNTALIGGGIYCDDNCAPTITDCTIENNLAASNYNGKRGGGIYCRYGSTYISGCTITGNSSGVGPGGGVYLSGVIATISNCTIEGNSAGEQGGGIFCEWGSPTISDCTISGNTSWYGGGGIYCNNSSPAITNCTISDNIAANYGGGIYCDDNCAPTITDCTIDSNAPTNCQADQYSSLTILTSAPASPSGACCVSSGCHALTETACAGMGGTWLGEGGSCDDCPASCMGDTDGNGVVNIEDLLNMLGSWGACP